MQSKEHDSELSVESSHPMLEEEVRAHINALKASDYYVRRNAAATLSEIGADAVPALIGALEERDVDVRRSAAEVLGKIGDPRAVPALIEALKDNEVNVSFYATWALGKLGDARVVPALIEALKDSNDNVRWNAVRALGQIGDADAVPAMIEALDDGSSSVRSNAAKALGQIGDAQTLPLQILSSAVLTPASKLDKLEALRRVRYAERTVTLLYRLSSVTAYCQYLLVGSEVDEGVREGAKTVLTEVEQRARRRIEARELLRPTEQTPTRDVNADGTQLVRAASSVPSSTPPDEHLRPSEPPTEREEKGSSINRWLRSIFRWFRHTIRGLRRK